MITYGAEYLQVMLTHCSRWNCFDVGWKADETVCKDFNYNNWQSFTFWGHNL